MSRTLRKTKKVTDFPKVSAYFDSILGGMVSSMKKASSIVCTCCRYTTVTAWDFLEFSSLCKRKNKARKENIF